MLNQIPDLAEGTLGFEAKGKVTGGDYEEVMIPALEAALEGRDTVRFLYLLGDDFEGYTGDAAWEDTKLGMHHVKSFERVAMVTDHPLYRDAVKVFGKAMPSEVKVFSASDLAAAKAWIQE